MTDAAAVLSPDILAKLPKIDLHLHLEGAARPQTLMEFTRAAKAKVPTDDLDAFRAHVQVPRGCRSLSDFLKVFDFFMLYLKNPAAVERIAYEIAEDNARLNVKYVEVRFAPSLLAHDNFSQEDVVKAAGAGLARGEKDCGIKTNMILCCYRSIPDQENKATVALAEKYLGRGVAGVDLAGDEAKYATKLYSDTLNFARERNVPFTCHAGEAAGPDSIEQALNLGARRLGHGVRLDENPALFERVKAEQIPLEMCLTSNVVTQAVRGFAGHPAKRYLEDGLCVTLNSDDPTVLNTDIAREYDAALGRVGFSVEQLKQVVLNGVEAAFLSDGEKKKLKKTVEGEFNALNI